MSYKANIIRKRRTEMNMTQEQLAEKMNVARQTIAGWEKETQEMKIDALPRLADILNCDIDYLLGRQEQPRKEIADASEVTGLSYEAVQRLKNLHHDDSDECKAELIAMNAVICERGLYALSQIIRQYIIEQDEYNSIMKTPHVNAINGHLTPEGERENNLYKEIRISKYEISERCRKIAEIIEQAYREEKNHAAKK